MWLICFFNRLMNKKKNVENDFNEIFHYFNQRKINSKCVYVITEYFYLIFCVHEGEIE